ncbi:MAG: SDR family oxidoreductase [Aquificae bacterium]|nr:SDR family oxidoreductase [Aquificota bacterium]
MEKVALITGIKRVGKEVAKELLYRGYNLSVVYLSSEKEAREIEGYGNKLGKRVLALKRDLSNPESFSEVVEETYKHFGRLDAFIHLASPYRKTPISSVRREDLYDHFVPIAEAFFFISQKAYELMLKNEGDVKGRIVAFGDWAVEHTPYKDYSAYFLAKGALHTAVRVLAKEFAPHVLVNCIALGPTLKAEGLSDEEWKKILGSTPLKREVSLEDVRGLLNFLLSAESITGEVIMLDSGRHIAGSGVRGIG